MSEPQVKGMAVINARDWLEQRLGAGWFIAAAREHDPSWPDRVLPGEWYSVRTELHVFERAFEALDGYESLEQLMMVIAADVALKDLNGILRAFLWVASPRMFLRTAPKIWDTYGDFTRIDKLDNQANHFRVYISDIPADIVGWIASAWQGFLPPALELAGGRDPRGEIIERRETPGAQTWELVYELRYS